MISEIEKLFIQESREKKRVGRGVYNRASRRGYVRGGVKTAYDYMTIKERKKLNSEVRSYHMYDLIENVPPIEHFKTMDKEKAKKDIIIIKNNFSNHELRVHWNINNYKLYALFKEYDVPLDKKGGFRPRQKTETKIEKEVATTNVEKEDVMKELSFALDTIVALLKTKEEEKKIEPLNDLVKTPASNFKIEFNGEFTKKEIEDRLINFTGTMLEGRKYKINFTLEELKEPIKKEATSYSVDTNKNRELLSELNL